MSSFAGVAIIVAAAPGEPTITVDGTTATSISLSWSVPSGSMVDSYEVMWTSDECPGDVDEGNATISGQRYTIKHLREGTSYRIVVNATNSAGAVQSDTVTGETNEAGEWPFYIEKCT